MKVRKNPTLADHLERYKAEAAASVAQFEKAATALEEKATLLNVLAEDAHQEADALRGLAIEADNEAERARTSAHKIRSILS